MQKLLLNFIQMINISKNKKWPDLLSEYRKKIIGKRHDRKTIKADYDDFCNNCQEGKKQVQENLLAEQDNLCCYCMKKISNNNIVIEHFKPKHKYGNLSLTYNNLIGSCNGKSGGTKHCDNQKQGSELRILPNPSDSTFNLNQIIGYSSSGEIKLKDAFFLGLNETDKTNYLFDINETLKLNNDELKRARNTKSISVINQYKSRKQKKKNLTIGEFFKGKKIEYHGFVENMLFKKFNKQ